MRRVQRLPAADAGDQAAHGRAARRRRARRGRRRAAGRVPQLSGPGMTTLQPLPASFPATVAALHRVAEEIVAPARKPDNEIALVATPGGFGTPEFEHAGGRRQVRVEGAELVDGERRAPLTTLEDARQFVGDLVPGGPLSGEPLDI